MKRIFVNLKRFDVPRSMGGVCPDNRPENWIRTVISRASAAGRRVADVDMTFFVPEALIIPAVEATCTGGAGCVSIGSQGVFRTDAGRDGAFGAFTTFLPAAAARNMGCKWSIIGHSEERRAMIELIAAYDRGLDAEPHKKEAAARAVDQVIASEISCALARGMNVLACVGETADETEKAEAVLRRQILAAHSLTQRARIAIAYEPIWAIGPNKTPPGADHIEAVSSYIKRLVIDEFGYDTVVVYGGGLKRDNAAMIGAIPSVDGGLVALTNYTGQIGYDPAEFEAIVERYIAGTRESR